MHDWKAIVRPRLTQLDLGPSQREEVAAELAGHLEDLYEQFQAQGLGDREAVGLALAEAVTWEGIVKDIQRAKRGEGGMNRRTRTMWLPGLVTFTAASISLMLLERAIMSRPALLVSLEHAVRLQPTLWWKDQVVVMYLCWWILLPLCGAAGAYLSRRAGGTRLACIAASLLPAIVMLGIFCFVLPVSLVIERNAFVMQHPLYYVLAFVNWAMVPGLALILGALPFLRQTTKIQHE